jgi:hypothetical protein
MTYWQTFWIVIGSILAFVILLILLVSGSRYSISDTKSHAVDYAGEIKEGHGGVTRFLWVLFLGIFIWTIIYFIIHWYEFAILTAYAQ